VGATGPVDERRRLRHQGRRAAVAALGQFRPKGGPEMTTDRQLAQLNIARPRAALDDPLMAEFMGNLERINALGDASPGFVWRLQGESGDATALEQPFGLGIIVNMTVWTDLASLRAFAFRSEHARFLRRRAEWFGALDGPHLVLWWVPRDHRPSLAEAKARLDLLAAAGPSPAAFTFTRTFAADGLQPRRAAGIPSEPT
jgi:hypothetical protein